ncbi:MAG: four-carbon acid sugar kinase family protein [Pseudomonadota bacterium]
MSRTRSPRIAILADDLTSAADGASPFVERGLAAKVGRSALPEGASQVVAVDVGSRSLDASCAATRMTRFAEELRAADILIKTVDSTLRGHVRLEIAVALRGSGRSRLVFAPAFPAAGRTTQKGVQLVEGVPVDRSAYARDPVHPVRTALLAELVPHDIAEAVLLDARDQDALDRQVGDIARPEEVLWAGSPGLSHALAKRFGTRPHAAPLPAIDPILVVVGSANPISHRQADMLRGCDGITVLTVPRTPSERPPSLLAALADEAADAITRGSFGALFATGGDTMDAVLDRLAVRQFDLLGELEPGVPFGAAQIGGRTLVLGMKAGGFGDERTLRRLADRLTQQTEDLPS